MVCPSSSLGKRDDVGCFKFESKAHGQTVFERCEARASLVMLSAFGQCFVRCRMTGSYDRIDSRMIFS